MDSDEEEEEKEEEEEEDSSMIQIVSEMVTRAVDIAENKLKKKEKEMEKEKEKEISPPKTRSRRKRTPNVPYDPSKPTPLAVPQPQTRTRTRLGILAAAKSLQEPKPRTGELSPLPKLFYQFWHKDMELEKLKDYLRSRRGTDFVQQNFELFNMPREKMLAYLKDKHPSDESPEKRKTARGQPQVDVSPIRDHILIMDPEAALAAQTAQQPKDAETAQHKQVAVTAHKKLKDAVTAQAKQAAETAHQQRDAETAQNMDDDDDDRPAVDKQPEEDDELNEREQEHLEQALLHLRNTSTPGTLYVPVITHLHLPKPRLELIARKLFLALAREKAIKWEQAYFGLDEYVSSSHTAFAKLCAGIPLSGAERETLEDGPVPEINPEWSALVALEGRTPQTAVSYETDCNNCKLLRGENEELRKHVRANMAATAKAREDAAWIRNMIEPKLAERTELLVTLEKERQAKSKLKEKNTELRQEVQELQAKLEEQNKPAKHSQYSFVAHACNQTAETVQRPEIAQHSETAQLSETAQEEYIGMEEALRHPNFREFMENYQEKAKPKETMQELRNKQTKGGIFSPSVYGEVKPLLVYNLIRHAIQLAPKVYPQVFFDLGSGTGAVVAQVAHQTGWKVIGVEQNVEYNRIGRIALTNFKQKQEVINKPELITGDFTSERIIIVEATVIFINNYKMQQIEPAIVKKLTSEVQRGTIVITILPFEKKHIPKAVLVRKLVTNNQAVTWNNERYTLHYYRMN